MAKKNKKVDWERFWAKFDEWCKLREKRCSKCGHSKTDYPEWPDQKKKIQRLFEKHVLK